MVVGDDVTVGRNDEAGTDRSSLPGAGRALLRLLRDWRSELAEEFFQRVRLLLADGNALLGRDVDHRRLQPGCQLCERHWRAGRRHGHRGVLRDLRSNRAASERKSGPAKKQSCRDTIGITHCSGLLRLHRHLFMGIAEYYPRTLNASRSAEVPSAEVPMLNDSGQ